MKWYYQLIIMAFFIGAFSYLIFGVVPQIGEGHESKWERCNDYAWKVCAVEERINYYEFTLEYTDYFSENVEVYEEFEKLNSALYGCYNEVAELCDNS